MDETGAVAGIVAAIRQDMAKATEALMTASEAGLRDVDRVRSGDVQALLRLEEGFLSVLQACALEDLIGQRLTQLEALCSSPAGPDDGLATGLENGPALPDQGLDQAAVDAWLG